MIPPRTDAFTVFDRDVRFSVSFTLSIILVPLILYWFLASGHFQTEAESVH